MEASHSETTPASAAEGWALPTSIARLAVLVVLAAGQPTALPRT